MSVSCCICVLIIFIMKINGHDKDLLSMISIAYLIGCHVFVLCMKIIRISYRKRRINLKGKYVLVLLFVMLLAACGQVEPKKKQKVEETVNEVKETIGVTVIQKHKEKKLQESEAKLVIDILNKAEKQEITGSFGEPEYEIQISRDGKTYYAWLRGEDRRGWVQYKKAMYMLNEKDTEKLLDIFPNVSEQKDERCR